MSQITDTSRVRPITSQSLRDVPSLDQEILQRITGLIRLGFGVLNALICMRFMLKLMAANPENPFARLVYSASHPFLVMFQGLTYIPSVNGVVFEFHDLIAIAAYGMLG